MGSWPSGISAITLFVEDLDAAKQFYREVFGLPVGSRTTTRPCSTSGTRFNLLKTAAARAHRAGSGRDSRGRLPPPAHHRGGRRGCDVRGVGRTRRGAAERPMDRPWGIRPPASATPAATSGRSRSSGRTDGDPRSGLSLRATPSGSRGRSVRRLPLSLPCLSTSDRKRLRDAGLRRGSSSGRRSLRQLRTSLGRGGQEEHVFPQLLPGLRIAGLLYRTDGARPDRRLGRLVRRPVVPAADGVGLRRSPSSLGGAARLDPADRRLREPVRPLYDAGR